MSLAQTSVATAARLWTANALTARAFWGSLSAPSTSLNAAQFTMTSGFSVVTYAHTLPWSVTSNCVRERVVKSCSSARTSAKVAPSCPCEPSKRIFTVTVLSSLHSSHGQSADVSASPSCRTFSCPSQHQSPLSLIRAWNTSERERA